MSVVDDVNLNYQNRLVETQDRVRCMCVLPGTESVLLGGDGVVLRMDGDVIASFDVPMTDKWDDPVPVCALAGVDAETFCAASLDHLYRVQIGTTLTEGAAFSLESERASAIAIQIALSRDGKVIAATASDYLISICEGTAHHAQAAELPVWGVAVSPDGSKLINGRENGAIEIRDPATLEVVGELEKMEALALCIAFSPDGKQVAVGDDRGAIRVFDLEGGSHIDLEHWSKAVGLSWLSDGSGLVVTALSRMVSLFRPDAPEPLAQAQFDYGTRYFQHAVLINDKSLAIHVEDHGILLVGL